MHTCRYLLAACGNRVRVYARQTGQLVEELIHHSDTVTSIALDRRDNAQVHVVVHFNDMVFGLYI